MTKTEYMNQLQRYLKRLPREDYEDTIDYFEEYFDEMGEENIEQAIQDLGTPKEAAHELLNRLIDTQLMDNDSQKKPSSIGKNILIAVLALCAAPIGIPVLITVFALIISGIVVAASTLLLGLVLCLAAVLIAVKLIVRGALALTVSVPGGLMIIGTGVFCLGCGILLSILVVYVCIWIGRGILLLAKKISQRVREDKEVAEDEE